MRNSSESEPPNDRSQVWQFSLRTLFVTVTVAAVTLAIGAVFRAYELPENGRAGWALLAMQLPIVALTGLAVIAVFAAPETRSARPPIVSLPRWSAAVFVAILLLAVAIVVYWHWQVVLP